MDFTTLEPAIRLGPLAGLFVSVATLAGWFLVVGEARRALVVQVLVGLGALASLPAMLVAGLSLSGRGLELLNPLAYLALAGGGLAVVTTFAFLLHRPRAAATHTMIEPGPAVTSVPAPPPISSRPAPAQEARTIIRSAAEQTRATLTRADGTVFRLGTETNIGRGPNNHVVLLDPDVSRQHARIVLENGRYVLHDLASANGTFVIRAGDRQRISGSAPLEPADIILVAAIELTFAQSGDT